MTWCFTPIWKPEGTPGRHWVSKPCRSQESRVESCLSFTDAAIRPEQFPFDGTPTGMLTVPAADLQVHGSASVTVAGAVPETGQETLFCLPVLTAPAFVKRDGTTQDGSSPFPQMRILA